MTSRHPGHAVDSASGRGGMADVAQGKLGILIFLATDAMAFGGLFLAYAVLRVHADTWPDPATRFARGTAACLTFVLLASGATMGAALTAAREGRGGSARRWLAATGALGLVFVLGQGVEFRALALERHVGLAADHAASVFYVLAGYHGLHVIAGLLVLATVGLKKSARARDGMVSAVEVASLYWQFVDLVWMVIFIVVYLIPAAPHG